MRAMAEAAAGPVLYVLRVPAIGPEDYARMQTLLVRGAWPGGVRWGRLLAGLAGGALFGGLAGWLASVWDLQAELWVMSPRKDWQLGLEGLGIVLGALGVALATLLAMAVSLGSRRRRGLRALHAAGGELFGAHDLLVGEDGLLWRNASRILFVPWSRMTGGVRRAGMVYLLADGVSAFWLPEALVAAHPDRAGLEALLRERAQLP